MSVKVASSSNIIKQQYAQLPRADNKPISLPTRPYKHLFISMEISFWSNQVSFFNGSLWNICFHRYAVYVVCQTSHWRHRDQRDGVSNHQPHDCLLNCIFRRRTKKRSKLRVSGLCAENSPVTGEFLAQKAGDTEKVSIWWRHHDFRYIIVRNT